MVVVPLCPMQEGNASGPEEQKAGIHQVKDKFAREMLGHREVAIAFLKEFFPETIADADWSSFQQESGSFINTQYRSQYSDLLYSLKRGEEETLIYVLIEHKSQQEYWTVFYLLQLMLDIWAKWRESRGNGKTFLPPILPIILHQSRRVWTAPLRFEEYFKKEHALGTHIPKFNIGLVDLPKVPAEQIGDWLLETVISLMKVVIEEGRSKQWLVEHVESLSKVEKSIGKGKVNFMLDYLAQTEEVIDISTIMEIATKIHDTNLKENVMTWAESLKQEGRGEGRQEGFQEGLQEGRSEGELRGIKIGQIITRREQLGMEPIAARDMASLTLDQLEKMANELKAEVKKRFKSS